MNQLAKIETQSLYPVKSEDVGICVDVAIREVEEMSDTFSLFDRSQSDMMHKAMGLHAESDTRCLYQLTASIKRKRDALVEVSFAYRKGIVEAEIKEERVATLEGLERKLAVIEAQESRAHVAMKHEAIVGATKDISVLRKCYEKIKGRILENHGELTAEVYEKEERFYWIKRSFIQSIRDVRACGSITKGEQELFEQIGIDPMEALLEIQSYLGALREMYVLKKKPPKDAIEQFLDAMVMKFTDNVNDKLKLME